MGAASNKLPVGIWLLSRLAKMLVSLAQSEPEPLIWARAGAVPSSSQASNSRARWSGSLVWMAGGVDQFSEVGGCVVLARTAQLKDMSKSAAKLSVPTRGVQRQKVQKMDRYFNDIY